MSTKRIGLLLVVGGILAVPVIAAWIYPHPVAEATVPDVKAVLAPQSTSESSPVVEAAPAPIEPSCIIGFSKNLCNGKLASGKWDITKCGDCINLVGVDAKLEVNVQHNTDPCSETSVIPCDETTGLGERLTLSALGEFHLRLNGPCFGRGWWQAPWTLQNPGGQIATGWLDGTMGTGTHRVPACISPSPGQRCGDKCESCYMTEVDISSIPGRWFIHFEGSMVGTVLEGVHAGCLVRVTIQGYFTAPTGYDGLPIPPSETEWTFCGTADGVLDCPCQ